MSQLATTVFGVRLDGRAVHEYVLEREGAPRVTILDQGATVNSIRLNRDDPATEVAVGFACLQDRLPVENAYFGAVVGRYANRISRAEVEVDGAIHLLSANDGTACLHGGAEGFDRRMWCVTKQSCDNITFELTSPEGDQGFPGALRVAARYRLIDSGLALDLSARTTTTTPCQLTSHTYFNLKGRGVIDDHVLTIPAARYIPVDTESIPLGDAVSVEGTPFDFRQGAQLRERLHADDPQIRQAQGLDHSFDVDGAGLRLAARLSSPRAKRALELWTDAPALQIYTGNALDGRSTSSTGDVLAAHHAIALEPQLHPDAPHQAWSAGCLLRAGETWTRHIEWHFMMEADLH